MAEQKFSVEWYGFMKSIGYIKIPIGSYFTLQKAIDIVKNMGPESCLDGTLTIFETKYPGKTRGAKLIKRWDYRVLENDTTQLVEL